MYLIYTDESGNASFRDNTIYILTSVLIHESQWRSFNRKIKALKEELFHDPTVEFHTSQMFMLRNDFANYSKSEIHDIFKRMANIIKKNSCTILSVILNKKEVESKHQGNEWLYTWSWRPLLERVEMYLERRNDDNRVNFGLICMDNNLEDINAIHHDIIEKFREDGSLLQDGKYLIEDPFFVESHMREMIALPDFVGWIVKQWYERRTGNTRKRDEIDISLFDAINDRFDTGPNPDRQILGYGIKIFPE